MNLKRRVRVNEKEQQQITEDELDKFARKFLKNLPAYNLTEKEMFKYLEKYVKVFFKVSVDETHMILTLFAGKKLKDELSLLRNQFSQVKINIAFAIFKILQIRKNEELLSQKKDSYQEYQKIALSQIELLDAKYMSLKTMRDVMSYMGRNFPFRNSIAADLNDATFLLQDLNLTIQDFKSRFYVLLCILA